MSKSRIVAALVAGSALVPAAAEGDQLGSVAHAMAVRRHRRIDRQPVDRRTVGCAELQFHDEGCPNLHG